MFDSLAERMKADERQESTTRERAASIHGCRDCLAGRVRRVVFCGQTGVVSRGPALIRRGKFAA